jgi:hypothetical protein
MKNCSYCGAEADDTAAGCSACGTEFRSSTPSEVDPQLTDPDLSLVIVGTYSNVVEAGMVRTRLEGAGIEACIPEEYTPQILWSVIPSPLECVTVRVAAKDYQAAKEILSKDAS